MDLKRVRVKRIRPGEDPENLMEIVAKVCRINNPTRNIQLITPKKLETHINIDSKFGKTIDHKIWQIQNTVLGKCALDDTALPNIQNVPHRESEGRRMTKEGNSAKEIR